MNAIQPGDWVHDPLAGRWRKVAHVEHDTVQMLDGGCMGRDECVVVALPSEDLSDRHYDRTFKMHADASYAAWAGDVIRRGAGGLFRFVPPAAGRQMLDGDVLVL